jgi:hypothetical protein
VRGGAAEQQFVSAGFAKPLSADTFSTVVARNPTAIGVLFLMFL